MLGAPAGPACLRPTPGRATLTGPWQVNIRDALLRTIGFTAPNGKQYRLRPAEELATLIVRCGRGRGTAN